MQELTPDAKRIAPSPSVDGVSRDREADIFEVYADLVGPTRLEANVDEREPADHLESADVRHGAPSIHGGRRHPRPHAPVPPDGPVDGEGGRNCAVDKRQVAPLDLALAQLRLKGSVCARSTGHDDEAARVQIESMNDAWADGIIAPGNGSPEECMHERPTSVARARMRRHAGRLLRHQKVLVLVVNRDGRVVGDEVIEQGLGRWRLGPDDLTRTQQVALGDLCAVDSDRPGVEPTLRFGATRRESGPCEELVDALT
jgi:hypothetical protein